MAVDSDARSAPSRSRRRLGVVAGAVVLVGAVGAVAGVAAAAGPASGGVTPRGAVLSGYAALVPAEVTNGFVGLSGQEDALPANSMAAGTVPAPGTISSLYVRVDGFSSGSLRATLLRNGKATTLACTVASSATATGSLVCSKRTGSISVAAGDEVSLRVANGRVPYHDLRWSASLS